MSETMDASSFIYAKSLKKNDFKGILSACVKIFKNILSHNSKFPNLENKIRDGFGKYLSNDEFKNKTKPLMNYHYEPEVTEKEGRIDMKFLHVNPYEGTKAYFIIECKRIDGSKRLNEEYVKNGVCRFVDNFYSSNFGYNGIFGFVVKKIDIDENITAGINPLLDIDMINDKGKSVNAKSTKCLKKTTDIEDYKFAYTSEHSSIAKSLILYHLMFDFSQNITVGIPILEQHKIRRGNIK